MHENFEPWLFWVTVLGGFTNINSGDIINSGGGSIKKPIEFSHPVDITFGEKDLNRKQQKILDSLPKYGDSVIIKKRDASMIDLAALTAKTGDEFAMFTRKGERMIVRGNSEQIPLSMENILDLRNAGYRWSGHTHPGFLDADLIASGGDKKVLALFRQNRSSIYNAVGQYKLFE